MQATPDQLRALARFLADRVPAYGDRAQVAREIGLGALPLTGDPVRVWEQLVTRAAATGDLARLVRLAARARPTDKALRDLAAAASDGVLAVPTVEPAWRHWPAVTIAAALVLVLGVGALAGDALRTPAGAAPEPGFDPLIGLIGLDGDPPLAVEVAATQGPPVAAPQGPPVAAPQGPPVAASQGLPVAAPQGVPVAAPQGPPVAASGREAPPVAASAGQAPAVAASGAQAPLGDSLPSSPLAELVSAAPSPTAAPTAPGVRPPGEPLAERGARASAVPDAAPASPGARCGGQRGEIVGYAYAGARSPGRRGDVWLVRQNLYVRTDHPRRDNGWSARARVVCTLPVGSRVALERAPIAVDGGAYWVPITGGSISP